MAMNAAWPKEYLPVDTAIQYPRASRTLMPTWTTTAS